MKAWSFMIIAMLLLAPVYALDPDPSIVADTLLEGQTMVYTINGNEYEVTLVWVSDATPDGRTVPEAKFSVNGALSGALNNGDTQDMQGLVIKVFDVYNPPSQGVVRFQMESTAAPAVTAELRVGETRTYTVGGVDYEVTPVFVSDQNAGTPLAAKVSVNGQLSKALSPGQSEVLSSIIKITVNRITINDGQYVYLTLEAGNYAYTPPSFPPGSIPDTLREGETKTYTIDGRDYEITLVYLGSREAKFSVNGELTGPLTVGSTQTVSGGALSVQVREIMSVQGDGAASFLLQRGQFGPVPPAPGAIPDKLREGETKSYVINGRDFEITLVWVSDPAVDGRNIPEAKFSVNGDITAALTTGGSDTAGGIKVTARQITMDSREGAASFELLYEGPAGSEEIRPSSDDPYIIVVGKYSPAQDVLTSIDIAKYLQESGVAAAPGLTMLDDQFLQQYGGAPEAKTVILIRGKHVYIIVGERSPTGQVKAAYSIKERFSQSYEVTMHVSSDVGLDLFRSTPSSQAPGNPGVYVDPIPGEGTGSAGPAGGSGYVPSETPAGTPAQQPARCDSGCIVNDWCIPVGTRLANGEAQYCGIEGSMKVQVVDGSSCQNNYECISNQCLNAQCASLEKELRETRSMMQSFMEWWSGLWG